MKPRGLATKSRNDGWKGATALRPVPLPKPTTGRSAPLLAILRARRTVREIGDKKLTRQTLSNLLWAACGVNRSNGPFGDRGVTAASASNAQEIAVYAALEEGIFRYVPTARNLVPVVAGDYRALAIGPGQEGAGANAPIRLIYVAEIDRFSAAGFQEPGLNDPEIQKAYYYVDTGLIAANVYLFAAAQGLAAWFHNCSRGELARLLRLGPNERVLFGQTVGYPVKERRRETAPTRATGEAGGSPAR